MVTIVDYRVSKNSDGKSFCSLLLEGGMELVKSKQTGNYYATARRTSITSTFTEATCKGLVGKTLAGSITKQECEPYNYQVPESGEIVTLHHTYAFVPDPKGIEEEVFA